MRGKVCVITGSSSGIGKATALGLAKLGARVVIAGHEVEPTRAAYEEIREATGNDDLEWEVADFSTPVGVRGFADAILARHDRVDVLHNNAGLLCDRHEVTEEGLEKTWAVNFFAPYLLTQLLLPVLEAAPAGRVINTASVAHRWGSIQFDRLNEPRRFAVLNYFDTKLALVSWTRALARRLEGRVTVNCLHPGVIGTDLAGRMAVVGTLMRVGRPVLKSPTTGAQTPIYLASSPEVENTSGEYFVGRRPRAPHRKARDEGLAERVWTLGHDVVGST